LPRLDGLQLARDLAGGTSDRITRRSQVQILPPATGKAPESGLFCSPDSEFHPRTGQHNSERVNTPNPNRKTLVRDEVFEFETNRSRALGKLAFARYIENKSPPFDEVSFEGFRRTFEALQETAARIVDDTAP
jgi:hypothetical protein